MVRVAVRRVENQSNCGLRTVLMASGERAIIRNSLFRLIHRLFHAPRTIMRRGQGVRWRSTVAARDVRYGLVVQSGEATATNDKRTNRIPNAVGARKP